MVARSLWLWLCISWLMTWLVEAWLVNPSAISICDLDACRCARGKVQCDCSASTDQSITLKDELLGGHIFSSIMVANCAHVHVASQAFHSLQALRQLSIANVDNLTLEERAFSWTTDNSQHGGLLLNITDTAIPEIPSFCFRGSLRDIMLTDVNVSIVRSFAFSSIDHADKIAFTKVNFTFIEPQSFKRFSVDFLTFSDSHLNVFPTRAIMNLEVQDEVQFNKMKVDVIKTAAIKIYETRKFRLFQSAIGHIEPSAFVVQTKGDVAINDNIFSYLEENSFQGITVDWRYLQEAGRQDLVFSNNTLVNFESTSLTFNTTGFNTRLDWIMINQSCSCENSDSWTTEIVSFNSETTIVPGVDSVMFCSNANPTSVKDYQRLNCNFTKYSLLAKISIISAVVLVLCVVGTVVYCCFKKKGKRYINVAPSRSALKPAHNNKANMLVVPDGKTYRETELHVIVEHVEPIINTEYVKERPDNNENR